MADGKDGAATGGEVKKQMTAKEFDDQVDGRVRNLFREKDSSIVDLVKGVAKEQLSNREVLDGVMESAERAQKSWNSRTDEQKALALARATESPDERAAATRRAFTRRYRGQRVAKSVQHLPIFRTGQPAPEVELGTGELTTRALLYAFKSYQNLGRLSWKDIQDWAKRDQDEQMVELLDDAFENKGFVNKDLQATDFSEGGAFVPAPVAVDFIAFLHGLSAIRALDPVILNPTSDSVSMGRFSSTVSAGWVGEGGSNNASTQGTEDVTLVRHDLEVKVIQSLRFLKAAPGGIEEMVRDDMRKAAKHKEEETFLRSPGSNNEPMGLKYLMASANRDVDRTQAGSVSTVEEIIADLLGLQERVHGKDGKVGVLRPAYIGQHRTKMGLMAQVDANDNPAIFVEMLANDMLFNAKFGTTTNLPESLDVDSSGNSDHTELYYTEMSEFVVADWLDMEMQEFREATITDGSGQSYNLAERRARALLLTHSTDTALKHARAAAQLKNVDWGADALNV